MSRELDSIEIDRSRARRMVADRLSDRDIDLQIMYSDSDRRDRIWSFVIEARNLADSGALWDEVLDAYERSGDRPAADLVASNMGISRRTLQRRLDAIGVDDWRSIHAKIAVGWRPDR